MELTPRSELDDRVGRIQARLVAANDVEAVFIFQAADMFYFAGTVQDAWLVIGREGPPLFLVRRSLERARAESALEHILPLDDPREVPGLLARHGLGGLRRVGLEFDVLPVQQYVRLGRLFPTMQFVDWSMVIREVRMIKSAYEVSCIRRAAAIQHAMAGRMKEVLRPGMMELEVAAEIEAEARRLGHQGVVRTRRFNVECFYGHLLGGESGGVPSWLDAPTGGSGVSPAFGNGAGTRRIQPHEPILLDYVGVCDGYISDQTRLFALGGLPADLLNAYEACLAIQEDIRAHLRPGVKAGDLYARGVTLAERLGYGDRFMNTGPAQVSFVGHGVGIELDEIPQLARESKTALQGGMTLAVEPKIVFPGRGIVGVEDTILITAGDPEYLTFTSREIVVI
ncbi:MAG TPA: Xaa-Pro peptidase family protein [Candidatus Methylomirabilis sp.]|nr:Xaa-Pro peptidase family protein [Candidatus Methylomirabilis sp.]